MNNPFFSVAIITYNQEQFIAKTLESILNQKHNYCYEIVIGDDCSNDNTREIIKKYKEMYPDIITTLFNAKNLGAIKNYYNVINHCNGKYIMECAGDDYWLDNKVSIQIELMEKNPSIGMSYGFAKCWDEKSQSFLMEKFGSKKVTFDELIDNNDIPAPSICMRKDLLEKYILEIDPLGKNWLMEDYPMWLWFSKNSSIFFIKSELAVYRVFSNSLSHSTSLDKYLRIKENYYEIKQFFGIKYNYNIEAFDIEKEKFYFYINQILIEYNSTYRKEISSLYRKFENRSIKDFIYYLFTTNKFLTKCLLCMIKIYQGKKEK